MGLTGGLVFEWFMNIHTILFALTMHFTSQCTKFMISVVFVLDESKMNKDMK